MNSLNTIYTKTYKINSIQININQKLGLFGLLGFLQDTAAEHAYELGFGYQKMIETGTFWVLTRQFLKMNKWPLWHDTITIKTWTLPVQGFYAIREFEIYNNNIKIGECSTTWMILDTKTRKPKEINEIKSYFAPRKDFNLGFTASKINVAEDLELQKTIEVKISDLDPNNHVNNIKYAQWALDLIPFKYHKTHTIKEYEINFLSETFLEDNINCFSNKNSMTNTEDLLFYGKNNKTDKKVFIIRIKA
ncbi:Acyl-ACP thioesterase [Lutibacter oricola]|uniref:Acyl-ACP thioesterase n=1 Tax=Lutibacter oricola TaxID=762486 RepID=A0A1H3F5R5_9FLAO|nr:acyl-ACP thioesterase domain-containing protein [Lutibacter oricola]SDX86363.1 Acyl-ACP thioesterase [Lutibacter oricola]